jgi:hypothetical protein
MADSPQANEKRFTLSFAMETEAFQGRQTADQIMKILGNVRGHVATGRFSGKVTDSKGNTVGEFLTTWRNDPPQNVVKGAKVLKSQ